MFFNVYLVLVQISVCVMKVEDHHCLQLHTMDDVMLLNVYLVLVQISICVMKLDNHRCLYPDPVWALVPDNTLDVKKAGVKCRLLTRTYTLQADRAKFSRGPESDICNLCKISHEYTRHFLLECSYLGDVREKHLSNLKQYMRTHFRENTFYRLNYENLLLQFILDPSYTKCCDVVGRIRKEHLYKLEQYAMDFTSKGH
jgi:hypothetical protein